MILVDVEIVCIQEVRDFWLNEELTTGKIASEMAAILRNLQREEESAEGFLLCSKEAEGPLDPEKTLKECGIVSGSHLILV